MTSPPEISHRKLLFSISTRRLVESVECLNSSLALASGDLWPKNSEPVYWLARWLKGFTRNIVLRLSRFYLHSQFPTCLNLVLVMQLHSLSRWTDWLWRAWRLATEHTNLQLDKNALALSHRKHPSHWWGLKLQWKVCYFLVVLVLMIIRASFCCRKKVRKLHLFSTKVAFMRRFDCERLDTTYFRLRGR